MEKESNTSDSQVPNTTREVQDTDQRNIEELPQLSPNALKVAAAQCLKSWINYLQILNTMCSAGLRLSQSLMNLSQVQNISLATNCQTSWEELLKSTMYATNAVKTHIAAAMQDMSIGDTFTTSDAQRQQDHNQQIITENLLTFVNLQYQFSLVGCEFFGAMAMCPSCQATPGGVHEPDCSMASLQQFFTRPDMQESRSQNSSPHFPEHGSIESPKTREISRQQSGSLGAETRGSSRGSSPIQASTDVGRQAGAIENIRGPFPNPGQLHSMRYSFLGRGMRSSLHFPLFPFNGQRRWSEAAAQDVCEESSDGTMRRWSMPWDSGRVEKNPWGQKEDVSPSKLIIATVSSSQERSRSATPDAPPPPSDALMVEGLAEAIQLLSCRPMRSSLPNHSSSHALPWSETHEERMHRRMHPGPSSQRGNWQSVDVPNSGMSVTEHYDIFPPCLPLISRKSSSSTDSSSCLSIHSRSTTSSSERGSDNAGGGDSIRIHGNLYSMWSASEHLPFIKLPEYQEPQDGSDTDGTPTEKSPKLDFPKPI